ncbi:transposase family protein [Crossiella sp. SN42]|uniref:transposase family protein n=1 Tax=Crossiella sp. SN42 TaxID=2944808 RepID=UPI00207CED9F|nr:transposase family protein [Crossiella sp. SN42]MCO1578869.1 transposase family protein [Crossiella sp. SN42]
MLLPHLTGVLVDRVEVVGGAVWMWASPRAEAVPCPRCGDPATRVHSRYERRLADSPVAGRKLVLRLRVRRWFCDGTACLVKTFAEQVDGLTVRDGRRRPLLRAMLERIAVALAGRAGPRLATSLSAPASRSTLLRLVMSLPDPSAVTPKVLGVDELLAQGHSIRGIARGLGWGQKTVQRYARAATWQDIVDGKWKGPRSNKLDPFKPYLQQRWESGCTNALQLHREIVVLGYPGAYGQVRAYLEQRRLNPEAIAPAPPTVRRVTGWLTRHPDTLAEDDQPRLKAVLEQCPELRAAAGHVRAFGEMMTKLQGELLPEWIAAVRADDLPGLTSFANGLQSDLDAVTAGLTTTWNSGPVEGRVNHIKMIKRQMFGRAGLALLRKRVLLTAVRH